MMENVLIDPNMLMLQSEEEVRKNIEFFRDLILLSSSGNISVCLYKEIIEQIQGRRVVPFPININNIKDRNLKESLFQLNDSFVHTIMNNYEFIDIEECSGQQDFTTDRTDLEEKNEYYDFFYMLLTPCYSKTISEKILTGEAIDALPLGEQVTISCCCGDTQYKTTYKWVSPKAFLSKKDRAFGEIRDVVCRTKNLFVESPIITKGQHHNCIQSTTFDCYEKLSAKNKRVFKYLRSLGLSRIIFAEFAPDTSCECGTINIVSTEESEDVDIMEGWFFGCIGFRIWVKLIFPKGMAKALQAYSQNELTVKTMEELITSLGLY